MNFKVSEIVAAGSYKKVIHRIFGRLRQHIKIKRFCLNKNLHCVEASVIFGNMRQDMIAACSAYHFGVIDAIVISGMKDWSDEEKKIFEDYTNNNCVKVIDLETVNYI